MLYELRIGYVPPVLWYATVMPLCPCFCSGGGMLNGHSLFPGHAVVFQTQMRTMVPVYLPTKLDAFVRANVVTYSSTI